MSAFSVTASELRRKADDLTGLNNRLKSEIGTLEGYEGQLASMWEGQAQAAFRNAFNNDKGQMNAFASAIDQYVTALLNIAAKYEQAEQKNQEIASSRTYK
ncbi:MAG: WXG100 family type VII secretion target [Clostridiaceae bacterium]|nr:WXG100 family type VII secretion target [Clostridiaceae bacterium]